MIERATVQPLLTDDGNSRFDMVHVTGAQAVQDDCHDPNYAEREKYHCRPKGQCGRQSQRESFRGTGAFHLMDYVDCVDSVAQF